MATTIDMIAHCMFHQTPVDDRRRCDECGRALTVVGNRAYCAHCLVERPGGQCPICTSQNPER